MTPSNYKPTRNGTRFVIPGVVLGLLVGFMLFAAGPAFAAYQQVGTFGGSFVGPVSPEPFPEQDELGGVSSMAVNEDGAGGVPAGTVYAIGRGNNFYEFWKVARFSPIGEFQEAWTSSRRCGPEAPPEPPATHYPACETTQNGPGPNAVAVDQATGNVYVFSSQEGSIRVYAPDGSKLIAQFGENAAPGETTAASPEKFHGNAGQFGNMTVDDAGNVYVTDVNFEDHFRSRLMVFQPDAPGDYEHYVYTSPV
jgi:DNA-binding beta-propeller fold protein YncE